MTKSELSLLFWVTASLPAESSVIEFGSYFGASSIVLAAAAGRRGGKVFCVDTWQNQTMAGGLADTFGQFRSNIEPVAEVITPLRQKTTETRIEQIGRRARLGFIDADHSYESVKADIHTMLSLLEKDGQFIFHDSNTFSGVSRAVGELMATGEWQIVKLVDSLLWVQRAQWREKEWLGHD